MTERHPYHEARSDVSICNALLDGKPPADLDSINLPAAIKDILSRCWDLSPSERPTVTWCLDSMSAIHATRGPAS